MMTRAIATLLVFIFCVLFGPNAVQAYDPAIEDYTAYPLFLVEAVQPNILIIFDTSGSMNKMASGLHEDNGYHPDDFGAIVNGIAEGGDQTTLVDNDATFTEDVAVGDILHNIDDGSTGEITVVTDTTLTVRNGMFAVKKGVPHAESNDNGERYWVESQALKNPSSVEEGYYGYFVPTAHYTYSSNVFVRDDANGEWSGNFLNWLTMRRVDVGRKIMMGGLATSRTGSGNQHLIGEAPAEDYRQFPKIPSQNLVSDRHSPYDNTHFYRLVGGNFEVWQLQDGQQFDFTRDFTYPAPANGGDFWVLHDGTIIEGNNGYEITGIVADDITGTADGMVDNPRDVNAVYKYFLFDPDKDFPTLGVAPGWGFVNEVEDLSSLVGSVPATGQEIIDGFEALYPDMADQLLYDMFHYAGGGDGYVKCVKCEPDVEYRPCDGTADWADCQATNAAALNAALDALAGHLLIFTEPLDPDIPRGSNYEEAYRLTWGLATRVALYGIEVDRNESDPGEVRDFVDGNLAGTIQRIGDRARFGLEFYNGDEGGDIVQYVGSGVTDMINRIQNKSCQDWTPLAESLYTAIQYFRNPPNNTWDPFYFNDLGRFVECSKSFILQITDGESTMDLDIPAELQDYDGDGKDPGNYTSNGSDYLDDVALYGHINDLRTDLSGEQSLYYYGVFAFGSGSTLLQDAARNGAFEDVNGDNRPEPPGGNDFIRMTEWDSDNNGIPDTYFEAAGGYELERMINRAIVDILDSAASGTSVALPSTSGREQGLALQAYFKHQVRQLTEDIKFVGYLQPLWVDKMGNLREDTVADARLVPTEDKIIRLRFDPRTKKTYVDRFADDDGNFVADASEAESTVILEELNAVWEAGKKLALTAPSNRRIFTFVDSAADWDGICDSCSPIPSGTDFSVGETKAFTLTNLNEFKDHLCVVGTSPFSYSYLGEYINGDPAGTVDLRAENLVRFIRGEQLDGMRSRQLPVDGAPRVWKFGDIIYSGPTVLSPPNEAYDTLYGDRDYAAFAEHWKDRNSMVIIGANDGMLHAFRAGRLEPGDDPSTATKHEATYVVAPNEGELGSEAWAYIPFNLLPHLKWLADPDYTHVYYVDKKVKAVDVQIFQADTDHPHGWGTLLVGGMRLGGGPYPSGITLDGDEKFFQPAYFLMDITDPESPEVLAEFTHPNLGFSTSYPAITKVGDHWYVVFGSGPTPGTSPPYHYDGTSDQEARVFVIDLTNFMGSGVIREGLELFIFQGTDDNAMMAEPISVDKPLDYSADVIYIGESYWASNRWNGRMRRIKTNGSTNPNAWQMSTLLETASHQAISAPPASSVGFGTDLWVFFGTGKYLSSSDRADTNTQSLYGVHDTCMDSGGSCAALQPSDLYDVSDITVTAGDATAFNNLEDPFKTGARVGWKLDLPDAGERCLLKPSLLGGAVLVPTFIPDSDICSMGGDGKLYGLYFLTGTAHYKPIMGTNESNESIRSKSIGKGMPASIGIHVGKKEGGTGFVQTSTGNIVQQEITPPLKFKSTGVSWKQF